MLLLLPLHNQEVIGIDSQHILACSFTQSDGTLCSLYTSICILAACQFSDSQHEMIAVSSFPCCFRSAMQAPATAWSLAALAARLAAAADSRMPLTLLHPLLQQTATAISGPNSSPRATSLALEVLLPFVTRSSDTGDIGDYFLTVPGPPPDAAALLTGQTQSSLTWLTTAPGWNLAAALLKGMQTAAVAGDGESAAVAGPAAAKVDWQLQRYRKAVAVHPSGAIRKAVESNPAGSVKDVDSIDWSNIDLPPPEVLLTRLTEPLTAAGWSSQQLLQGCSKLVQLLQVDDQNHAEKNGSSSSSSRGRGSSNSTAIATASEGDTNAVTSVKAAGPLSPAALLQQPLLLQQLRFLLEKSQDSLLKESNGSSEDSSSSSSSSRRSSSRQGSCRKAVSLSFLAEVAEVATAATTLPYAIATLPAAALAPGDTLTKATAEAQSAAVAGKQLLQTVLQLLLTSTQLEFDQRGLQALLLAAGRAAAVAGQADLLQQLLGMVGHMLLHEELMGSGEVLGLLKVQGFTLGGFLAGIFQNLYI
jgi:hypothetical protein